MSGSGCQGDDHIHAPYASLSDLLASCDKGPM